MIRFEFTNKWKYNDDARFYFELIKFRFSINKLSWYAWFVDFTILNFEFEMYGSRR